jgi:hypothetical protein
MAKPASQKTGSHPIGNTSPRYAPKARTPRASVRFSGPVRVVFLALQKNELAEMELVPGLGLYQSASENEGSCWSSAA